MMSKNTENRTKRTTHVTYFLSAPSEEGKRHSASNICVWMHRDGKGFNFPTKMKNEDLFIFRKRVQILKPSLLSSKKNERRRPTYNVYDIINEGNACP
jgi:hypothetical protein